jgi:hypothetical protein
MLLISLTVTGLYMLLQPGRIFGRLGNLLRNIFPKESFLGQPVIHCPLCMTSVWGTAIYLLCRWIFQSYPAAAFEMLLVPVLDAELLSWRSCAHWIITLVGSVPLVSFWMTVAKQAE